jgi:serine/threonine protein kinase
VFKVIQELKLSFDDKRQISDKLKDFFSLILEKDPIKRATIKELLKHPWIIEGERNSYL